MKVKFRKIYLGRVIAEIVKEYDGEYSAHAKEIEDDSIDGCDPLELAMNGHLAYWVEAQPIAA